MKVRYRRNYNGWKEIEGEILNLKECLEHKTRGTPEYWLTILEGEDAGRTFGVNISPVVRTDYNNLERRRKWKK